MKILLALMLMAALSTPIHHAKPVHPKQHTVLPSDVVPPVKKLVIGCFVSYPEIFHNCTQAT